MPPNVDTPLFRATRCSLFALLTALLPVAVHAQSVPAKPTHLAAAPLDGQATLTWNDPSDSTLTGYSVRSSTSLPVGGSWTAIAGSGPATTAHTVAGLVNGNRYYLQIRASNANGDSAPSHAVSVRLAASPTTAVAIGDANLRARLEILTSKAAGEAVTQLDMASLDGTLDLTRAGISSLTGLEWAINVEEILLAGNRQIIDLTPLGSLTSLAKLNLNRNRISDLTPLSGLTSLTSLHLRNNQIADVTTLAGLALLEDLQLGENEIPDVTPLASLTSLRFLGLQDTGTLDVTPLGALTSLLTLSLGHNQIQDITPLASLTSLTVLELDDNKLSDITPLASLTSLVALDLDDNQIADLTPLSGLGPGAGRVGSLYSLDLAHNRVSDVAPLAGLTALRGLKLNDNAIVEVDALRGLTSLATLNLQNNAISNVAALAANPGIGLDYALVGGDRYDLGSDEVNLRGNPLSKESIYVHIPTMRRRGARIFFDAPPNASPEAVRKLEDAVLAVGGKLAVELPDAFRDQDNETLTLSAMSSRPAVAPARMVGYTLTVRALAEGQARITVRAEDALGASASLSFQVTVGNPVSFVGSGGIAAVASAPEGESASLAVTMARPRNEDVSFAYSFGPDADPATADADAADYGGEGGTVTIAAGETEATILVPILDDDDIEPARESFAVTLTSDDVGLGVASATVHIAEGVCDRTWQVADALRGGWSCEAVTAAELARVRTVQLADVGLAELQPLDFLGLTGMRTLILDSNGLSALPYRLLAGSPNLRVLRLRGNSFETLPAVGNAGALVELDLGENGLLELPRHPLAGLPALGYLYLDGNQIEAVPPDLLSDAGAMRILELQNNALHALPEGIFAGASKLTSLQLQGNPGAPFPLTVELARAEAEDEDAGWAEVQLRMPHAAPFAVTAGISAPGATLSADAAAIAAGDTVGGQVSVVRSVAGNEAGDAVTVAVTAVGSLPRTTCGDDFDEHRCFRGFELKAGNDLTLFEPPSSAQTRTLRMR